MIVDKISNIMEYDKLGIHADKILEFINLVRNNGLTEGRYDILGENLFALVQRYETKNDSECLPESHEKYADLQFIVEGREIIGWEFADELDMVDDRRPDSDIMFYQKAERKADIKLEKNMFVLLFPNDAHTPGLHRFEESKVFKIVFKIKYK